MHWLRHRTGMANANAMVSQYYNVRRNQVSIVHLLLVPLSPSVLRHVDIPHQEGRLVALV